MSSIPLIENAKGDQTGDAYELQTSVPFTADVALTGGSVVIESAKHPEDIDGWTLNYCVTSSCKLRIEPQPNRPFIRARAVGTGGASVMLVPSK